MASIAHDHTVGTVDVDERLLLSSDGLLASLRADAETGKGGVPSGEGDPPGTADDDACSRPQAYAEFVRTILVNDCDPLVGTQLDLPTAQEA